MPLAPRRDMRELRGLYGDLTLRSFYENAAWREDYLRVILTNEQDVPDALAKLRVIYPNIMRLEYDNRRTRAMANASGEAAAEGKTPMELFAALYEAQNNQPMSPEQSAFMDELIRRVWEDEA